MLPVAYSMDTRDNDARAMPWLLGPQRDVVFFLLPFVFSLALLAFALGAPVASQSVPFRDAKYLLVTFHVLLTFRFLGGTRLPIGGRQLAFAGIAIASCIVITVGEWYLGSRGRLGISAIAIALLYCVNSWNITTQSAYIVRLYRQRAGTDSLREDALDRQLIGVNALLFYGIGWFYLDQIPVLAELRADFFRYLFVLLALYQFVLCAIIVPRRVKEWRVDKRTMLPTAALLSALVYPWPMFLVLWKPEPPLELLTLPIYAHVAQYLVLHFFIFPRPAAGRFAAQCSAAAVGALLLWIAMRLGAAYYEQRPAATYCVQGFVMALAMLHSVGDVGLFRHDEQIGPQKQR
ncbi:hypothetical protein IT570_00920 [Candidatus Sumerlaeota bacterium]|nr:hypothetical protein [Candidatus Sumerlaeota bacterium]